MAHLTKRLREILHYNPKTGLFRWLIAAGCRSAGSVAGCSNGGGYIAISVDGRIYLAHRLAWLYMTGKWPPNQVDHRDVNRSNNVWTNLRLATNAENHANMPTPKHNTSGYKGVTRDARCPKRPWLYAIETDGKRYRRGYFATAEEAFNAREADVLAHHGDFARTG